MYGGCRPQDLNRPQEYENVHNIYLLDDMPDEFSFGRSNDRDAIQLRKTLLEESIFIL